MHDFSLCTPRKDILVNQNNSKVLSYIEPNQYTLNQRKNLQSPNFRKMKTRNFNENIYSNVPAVCTYSPNFDAISISRNPGNPNI